MKAKRVIQMTIGVVLFVALIFMTPVKKALADNEIIIIANSNVPVQSLSKDEIQDIFLGKKTTWPDNQPIQFFVSIDENLHRLFLHEYMNKSVSQYTVYWRKMIFTGKGAPPKSLKPQEMLNIVSETKGAIGYAAAETNIGELKKIQSTTD